MEYVNCNINISIDNQIFSIAYTFNQKTTFQDLLEYFVYLYPSLNICQCYDFQIMLNNYNYFPIAKETKITEYSNYLNNLQLYNNNQMKCVHDNYNFLLFSKINIFNILSKQINVLNNNKSKEITELNNKNKLLNDINKNNDILKELLSDKNKEIKELNDKIEQLNKENKKLNIFLKINDINKKQENFYDIVVHIDSIKNINKGWKVQMSPNAEKNYKNFKTQQVLRIGVIGNAYKGKSFILSKISKMKCPSGMSIKTEGLSIKYPDLTGGFNNRKIALLDSAGLDKPVLVDKLNDYKTFKERVREKLITELFLQNYIVNNSDILIVVVDSVSFSEQKLLMKVKKEMERSKRFVPLYVIHNLKAYTSKKQVEDYIQETLLKSATFSLKRALILGVKIINKSGIHFYEDLNEKEKEKFPNIFHLIYANEYSDAGKIYNQYTLNFIEKTYQNITNLKEFDVIKTIKERYINISKDIIEKTENEKTLTEESFDNSDPKIIKLKNKNEIILKKCLIDELGFSNFKANGFEPKYNIYNKDKNKIIVRVEIPGNCDLNSEVEIHGEYNIIKLTGEKKKDIEPANLEENIYNLRENGKFVLEIPLKFAEYRLSNKKPVIKKKLGVCIIEYELDIYEKVETPISEEDIVVI